jgi:HEPN domain-containing protein
MVDKDFDTVDEYVIQREELKSWNDDSAFKLNAMYFKFTKAYKIEVQLSSEEAKMVAIADLLLWPNGYFEIKPTVIKMDFTTGPRQPAVFQFYSNPYFKGLCEGKFEPRLYVNSIVSRVVVRKLMTFKDDSWCKYALFLIRRAKDMLDLATEKNLGQVYDLCMHFSRYCIEMSLKSIFPMFKMVFPREHDVSLHFSQGLRQQIARVSPEFLTALPRLLWISQQHISPDRFDLYGDSDSQTSPDLFVTSIEAMIALENARFCYQQCCNLFEKVMKAE